MINAIKWFQERPMACAALALFSIADALNCISLGHSDWWFPTAVALVAAFGIRAVNIQR